MNNITLQRVSYVLLALLLVSSVAYSAQNIESSPQQFWSEFRQAVINNDMKKLAEFTHFPLEVRGVDDSQPPAFYQRAKFAAFINKALQQKVVEMDGDQVITKNSKDMIIATQTPVESDMITTDSFRVDQFVFENINGKWQLVRVYIEQ